MMRMFLLMMNKSGNYMVFSCKRLLPIKGAAVFCLGLLVCILLGGCDLDKKKKAQAAALKGWQELDKNAAEAAEKFFLLALENDPSNALACMGIAEIEDCYNMDDRQAEIYMLRYFDLAKNYEFPPDRKRNLKHDRGRLQILQNINSGKLEAPEYAIRDIFKAAEAGDVASFSERMAPELVQFFAAQKKGPDLVMARFKGLSFRERPRPVYRKISHDGKNAKIVIRVSGAAGKQLYSLNLCQLPSAQGIWRIASFDPL